MNQKKSTKILMILIIIVLMIILLGGIAFAYFVTDIFRSEKDLFLKYITQIGDSEKGFIDNQLKEYFEKRKNTPYNDEGKFFVNITSSTNQEQFENVNNFNISFSGQIDTANSKAEQNISLNYSDDVNFPINYKKVENIIGLQTKYIGSKFIAIETDNLDNLTNESGLSLDIDTSILENISQVELTEEEKEHIQNTCIGVFNNYLGKEKFSKVQEADLKGYKLSLTGEELQNILVQLLETLKNDQDTLDIINQYIGIQEDSNKLTTDDIDDLIENIKDEEFEQQSIEITVYSKNGETSKIKISTSEGSFNIEKIQENNILKILFYYELSGEKTGKVTLSATFEGLDLMQNIKELYELEIQLEQQPSILQQALKTRSDNRVSEENSNEDNTSVASSELIQYRYQLENNISFTENVNIEKLSSNNSMILTNYEPEQVSNFLSAVGERITQVNKQQMEELGLEESENPIQYLIPSLENFSIGQDLINQTTLSEKEINTFNEKFENYEGTNQQAQTVKGLLSTITLNNETQENKKMEIKQINFNGEEYEVTEENISSIKNNINMEKNYRIEFEKNQDTGLIFRTVINEK